MTAIRDPEDAWRVHVEGSLVAAEWVRAVGPPVIDVGSGGGAPGIPLAAALPEFPVTLLEANSRKCAFLEAVASDFPNVRVVRGRAEEQPIEQYKTAVAKALAPPPVAAELCLPLVHQYGGAVIYVGPSADLEVVRRVGERLNSSCEDHGAFFFLQKRGPTPPGFPRRSGLAKKRPLG